MALVSGLVLKYISKFFRNNFNILSAFLDASQDARTLSCAFSGYATIPLASFGGFAWCGSSWENGTGRPNR